ncbi:hypothetical protein P0136_08705 [Lentisphaerota bacterium ZTH]|nr:hypothetical protein JYG24_00190 [Lentisphaerota bacterium]WET05443.1 hypothetical protein P0136_08705 [Lentisphaerota bacterium ZTH]
MRKLLLGLFISSLCLTGFYSFGQAVKKDDLYDLTSTSDVLDETKGATQWSLGWMAWSLEFPVNFRYALFSEVPAIGLYTDEGYNFRRKILVINLNAGMLELAPRNLRQAIIPGVTQFQNIAEIMAIAGLKCTVTAVITGKGSHTDDVTMVGKEFNISYHGLLAKYNSTLDDHDPVTFSRDLPMGMFVPKGILAASEDTIPMERFANVHQSCHVEQDDENNWKISPNNGRFVPIAEISSFWTVVKIGDQGENISITYHLLCNTAAIADAVRNAVESNPDNFNAMLAAVRAVGDNLNRDEFSKGVLKDWVDNISHISRPFSDADPVM